MEPQQLMHHAGVVRRCVEGDPDTICRVVGHDYTDAKTEVRQNMRLGQASGKFDCPTGEWSEYQLCNRCGKQQWLGRAEPPEDA
jgi:hypothetical protein